MSVEIENEKIDKEIDKEINKEIDKEIINIITSQTGVTKDEALKVYKEENYNETEAIIKILTKNSSNKIIKNVNTINENLNNNDKILEFREIMKNKDDMFNTIIKKNKKE